MNKDKYFSTPSLALASAIQLASHNKLLFIKKTQENNRALFVFLYSDELAQIIDQFWNKTLPLDAFSYFESTKYIKSRLYENA